MTSLWFTIYRTFKLDDVTLIDYRTFKLDDVTLIDFLSYIQAR